MRSYRLTWPVDYVLSGHVVRLWIEVDNQPAKTIRYIGVPGQASVEYQVPKDSCYTLSLGFSSPEPTAQVSWVGRLHLADGDTLQPQDSESRLQIEKV